MATKFQKSMEQIFDVTPSNEAQLPAVPDAPKESSTDDMTDAYEKSVKDLDNIIEQGKDALETMISIAKDSQHPRAFEVLSGLMKNLVDANSQRLNIQKQMQELTGEGASKGTTNIDKAIFVGSTQDLSKMLKNK